METEVLPGLEKLLLEQNSPDSREVALQRHKGHNRQAGNWIPRDLLNLQLQFIKE
jgi:hypothetical protein